MIINKWREKQEIGEDARTDWGVGGWRGCDEARKVVPSGCTVHPAARARAARTSFMSARAGSGKLPCCRSPDSMRLVMARRCRSLSFVRSFSLSLSLSPPPPPPPRRRGGGAAGEGEGSAATAGGGGVETRPRGRRCGGGSPSSTGECGCFRLIARRRRGRRRADLRARGKREDPDNAQGQSNTNTSTNNTPLTIPRIPPYPSRINTMEIKQLIQTRLGHERSERYFRYLKMFLGSRMEKLMFDRVVVQTIGRENIRLHNHLLMSLNHYD
uniref:Uncharacterized protein n=1 Tax=Oryza glumipatula TaxID=40148 RepID=A0A0D9YLT0_9ORYZ